MPNDSNVIPAALPDWAKDFRDPYGVPAWVYELRDRVATLETKVTNLMAQDTTLQAGFDELTQTLTAVAADVQAKAGELAAVEQQLTDLQAQTGTDLSSAIAQAKAIRQSLEGTAAVASGATGGDSSGTTTTADQTSGGTVASSTTSGADAGAAAPADTTTASADTTAPSDGSQTVDATA